MKADLAEIRRALALLLEPGTVAELRVLNTRRGTASGYFDDFAKLAEAAAEWSGQAPAVYITANPVKRTLLARAVNHVRTYAKHTTGDGDIAGRRRLLLDFDAAPVAGISTTDAEHQDALERARACFAWLITLGFTADMMLVADSGNGAHVVAGIDLPNDEASRKLVERCLAAVAFQFDDAVVKVDVKVGNAARIWKQYGTLAAKGDHTDERPHRLARILEAPAQLVVAPVALLERLAALAPQAEQKQQTSFNGTTRTDFNLETWIADHADTLHVVRDGPWNGGHRWILNPCPWNPQHVNGAAFIVQFPSGATAAGCHHNGCAGRDWRALRDLVEPERMRRRAGMMNGADTDSWDDPTPLDALPLPPFPVDALPPVLRDFVEDVARGTQVPADLPGLAVLAAVGAACARRADVAIGGTHTEGLNLYGVIVARSGERKDAVIRAALRPFHVEQERRRKEAAPRIVEATEERKAAEERLKSLRVRYAKEKDAAARAALLAELKQAAGALPAVPAEPTLLVADCTPEKLEMLLAHQAGVLLLASEEAGALFEVAGGRYAKDGTAQLDTYLKCYDGGHLATARVTREAVSCRDPRLSILVAAQPIQLEQFQSRPEFHHRGLLPRMLFAVPPSLVGARPYRADARPNARVRAAYDGIITELLSLRLCEPEEAPRLHVEGEALSLWTAYHDRIEAEMRDGGRLAGIREWANKQPARAGRIAGGFHLVLSGGLGSGRVAPATMAAATAVGEYLEAHALAAYDVMGSDSRIEGARRVLAWARRTRCATFSAREAFNALKGSFKTMEVLNPVLALLVEYGHLRELPPPPRTGPGRKPSPHYAVHPGSLDGSAEYAERHPPPHSADFANLFLGNGIREGGAGREPGEDDDAA